MFCGKCGTEVPEEFTFCTKCGRPVELTPPTSEAAPTPAQQSGPPVSAPEVPTTGSRASPSLLRTLLPIVLVLAIIGGFMAADRLHLHWYVPDDTSASVSSLESDVAGLTRDVSSLSSLGSRVSAVESKVSSVSPTSGALDLDSIERAARIANAVTINSLVNNYGGYQSSGSPAGKACFAWLMLGEGSGTDCGFTR